MTESTAQELAVVLAVDVGMIEASPGETAAITRVFRRCILERGGKVLQISATGCVCLFTSATVALEVAITLQRMVTEYRGIRIGVAVGLVQNVHGRYVGEPVSQTAKLLETCNTSTPMAVSPLIPSMICGPSPLIFQKVDHSKIFVRADPSLDKYPGRLPTYFDASPRIMAGREDAVTTFDHLMDSVAQERTAIASVTGEAGIGKTHLLSHIARCAADRGMRVLGGAAHEDSAIPFASVTDCLGRWVDDARDLVFYPGLSELSRLIPEIDLRVPGLVRNETRDPEKDQLRLFEALMQWLRILSKQRPLILILDSLHWEGEAAHGLLSFLIRNLSDTRMLMVFSCRTVPTTLSQAISEAKARSPECVREIALRELNQEEVRELLLGRGIADELVEPVHLATGGHPLHLIQLLDGKNSTDTLPNTLTQALEGKLSELSERVQTVLQAAGVVGAEFDALLVIRMLDTDATACDALDEATDQGLIQILDADKLHYKFAHSLIRSAVLETVGRARRAHLHARAADCLLDLSGHKAPNAGLLARLYTAAVSIGYVSQAVEWTLTAAEQALVQFANDDAVVKFSRAGELMDAPGNRQAYRMQYGLGVARMRLGDPEARRNLLQAADIARNLVDGRAMAEAMLATYRLTFTRARYVDHDAVRRLRMVLELLPDDAVALRAQSLALLAVELAWDGDGQEALMLSEQASELAKNLGMDQVAEVLCRRLWVLFHPLEERLRERDRLAAVSREIEDPIIRFEIHSHDVFTAIRSSNRTLLDESLNAIRAAAAVTNQPHVRAMLLLREANVALLEGRYAEYHSLVAERGELAQRIGQLDGDAAQRIQMFWLAYDCSAEGEFAGLVGALAARLDDGPQDAWAVTGFAAAEAGNMEVLRSVIDRIRPVEFAQNQIYLWNLAMVACMAVAAHDRQWASELIDKLKPHRDEIASSVFSILGPCSRYLGLLYRLREDLAAARREFDHAIGLCKELGAVSWVARTQCDLAETLVESGKSDLAQPIVEEVVSQATRFGWPRIHTRAANLR